MLVVNDWTPCLVRLPQSISFTSCSHFTFTRGRDWTADHVTSSFIVIIVIIIIIIIYNENWRQPNQKINYITNTNIISYNNNNNNNNISCSIIVIVIVMKSNVLIVL